MNQIGNLLWACFYGYIAAAVYTWLLIAVAGGLPYINTTDYALRILWLGFVAFLLSCLFGWPIFYRAIWEDRRNG